MSDWTTPHDVRAKLLRRWRLGEVLSATARGEVFTPIEVPLRGPTASELGDRFDDAQRWVGEWTVAAAPYRLSTKVVGGRRFGANQIPARLHLDTCEALTRFLGTAAEARRHAQLVSKVDQTLPALQPWVVDRPFAALAHAEDFDRLLACVEWVTTNAGSERYVREIDAPGVDTKFIETHRAILIELIDAAAAAPVIAPESREFAQRYGFRVKPTRVRMRTLDPDTTMWSGFTDVEVRIDELATNPPDVDRVFVVENEVTCLAFPPVPRSLLLFGGGYAVSRIAPLRWLTGLDLIYWGDIDTHGFRILDRLRAVFPHARSMLMDRATLLAHESRWETEQSPVNAPLPNLTDEEAALYRDLVEDALGPAVRLEQERVAYPLIRAALAAQATDHGDATSPQTRLLAGTE
jgi:hypothetical protein